jgi:hypothetical protein
LRERDETHNRLVSYIKILPEEQFTTETRVRRRIKLDCYSHYSIHARAIRKWRERKGLTKTLGTTRFSLHYLIPWLEIDNALNGMPAAIARFAASWSCLSRGTNPTKRDVTSILGLSILLRL